MLLPQASSGLWSLHYCCSVVSLPCFAVWQISGVGSTVRETAARFSGGPGVGMLAFQKYSLCRSCWLASQGTKWSWTKEQSSWGQWDSKPVPSGRELWKYRDVRWLGACVRSGSQQLFSHAHLPFRWSCDVAGELCLPPLFGACKK